MKKIVIKIYQFGFKSFQMNENVCKNKFVNNSRTQVNV